MSPRSGVPRVASPFEASQTRNIIKLSRLTMEIVEGQSDITRGLNKHQRTAVTTPASVVQILAPRESQLHPKARELD